MGGLWVLFSHSEKVASPDAKKAITRWLKNVKLEGTPTTWPSTFVDVFDSIFGKKHLSWHCFWRSCVASLIAVIVVTSVWGVLRPKHFAGFFVDLRILLFSDVLLFFYGLALVLLNLFPDYVSLLESRYIIRRMSAVQHSPGRILSLLALDVVLTVSIFLAALFLFVSTVVYYFGGTAEAVLGFYALAIDDILSHGVFLSSERGSLSWGIFFYSTFFTSVWVWLYALSGLVVKLAGYLDIGFSRLKWFLDIETKPLHSLGIISMLLVTLIYLGVSFYRLVVSS